MTKNSKNNDWLDDAIYKALGGKHAVPDFEQWKAAHPAALTALKPTGQSKPFISWGMIMRNRIVKLAAAAAIVAAVIGLAYRVTGSMDGANAAFAQMAAAVRKVPCMTIVETTSYIRQKTPKNRKIWVCFDANTQLVKESDGRCYLYNYNTHEHLDYSPEIGKIMIYPMKPDNFLDWKNPSDLIARLIQMGYREGSTIQRKEESLNGRLITVFDITVAHGTQREVVKLSVDSKSNLPLAAETRHYEGDVNTCNAGLRFEYPDNFPNNLHDLGTPRSAQIVRVKQRILRGHLVDTRGRPVNGLVDFGLENPVTTNESGEFSYPLPRWFNEPMRPQIGYALNRERTLGRGFYWKMKDIEKGLTVILEPFATFTGRVVDSQGQGVDEAKVAIWVAMPDGGGWVNQAKVPWKLKKEGNGRFTFTGVPIGLPLEVSAEKPGFQGKTPVRGVAAGTVITWKDIVLTSLPGFNDKVKWNAKLTGRVVDEKENPVPGVDVQVIIGTKSIITTTNSKGEYTLNGLPEGKTISGSVYLDGYGHTMYQTICDGRNFDIRLLPQGYEWYGKPAPQLFVEKWFNSRPITLEQYRGKVVLLQVGVYLQTGMQEMEKMQRLQKRYGDKGLAIISLHQRLENLNWAGKITEEQIVQFIKAHHIDFPFGLDDKTDKVRDKVAKDKVVSNGATYSLYGVKVTPTLYLIDKKGILRISPPGHDLNEWIEKLLAE